MPPCITNPFAVQPMGNNIAKKYDVPKEHTATAGHLGMWKIWPGKSKDSGNLCSIWVFDRNELAKTKKPATALTTALNGDKTTTEMLYQIMKKDLQVIKESQACQHLISPLEVRINLKIYDGQGLKILRSILGYRGIEEWTCIYDGANCVFFSGYP